MKKVNLFIVGAMKAGTTSFANMLGEHPNIHLSPVKEPLHFIEDIPAHIYSPPEFEEDRFFAKEKLESAHCRIVKNRTNYHQLFREANEKALYFAEASTAYLHAPESADLIHRYNPEAKIIIITRKPIARAYSHYKMDISLGRTFKSFKECITIECNELSNKKLSPWSYIGMSTYAENIQRFHSLFGENILVLPFETFHEENFQHQVWSFLHLPKVNVRLTHQNAIAEVRLKRAVFFLHKTGIMSVIRFLIPASLRHKMLATIQKTKSREEILTTHLSDRLANIFKEDQERTQQYYTHESRR